MAPTRKDEPGARAPQKKKRYSAEDITVLEGLEPVRKRPGMYIGTTGPDGLHHLVNEVFDNARDEAMGGFANDIEVALIPGNRVRVVDNGRGIPVDVHKQTKVSALETIMTTLHAGGKFGGEGYKISGGLHGVGVSVVNALSVYARAEVHRDGGVFVQEYVRGKRKAPVKRIGASKLTGTIVTFEPDPQIFPEITWNFDKITSHLRQQAYLVKKLRITVIDAREAGKAFDDAGVFNLRELGLEVPRVTFYFEGGLISLVEHLAQTQKPVHRKIFHIDREEGVVSVEVALRYVDDILSKVLAFANNTYNSEGGMHVTGFKTALTRTLNTYAKKSNLIKEADGAFAGDDALEGLIAVISVKLREIQFEGQTKAKLGSVEARGATESVFGEAFAAFLEENPDDARGIIAKALLAMKARKAAKAAKDSVLRKGALDGLTLPGKLADCQSKDPSESELFIVEGDSAGGCFSGDTKVALADGRDLSFRKLVEEHEEGKINYCYTIDEHGDVQIERIHNPRRTTLNADVLTVALDSGDEITCTHDHQFMLRDGTYCEARNLKNGSSLMPLHRKISKNGGAITIGGYEMIWNPSDHRWIFTHILADRFNIRHGRYHEKQKNNVIHHRDFKKRNNNPENLERMDKRYHLLFHTKNLGKTLHSDWSKEKSRQTRRSPEYREKIRRIMIAPEMRMMLSERAKKQWQDETYKQYMLKKFLSFYDSNEEYRQKNARLLDEAQRKYWNDEEHRKRQSERVQMYFEKHPDRKSALSAHAKTQWQDNQLRAWRAAKTRELWTPEFRMVRMEAYNKTYKRKALETLHNIYATCGRIDEKAYNQIRRVTADRSIIRLDTVTERFFDGDRDKLEEAVINFNHGVKAVTPLSRKTDVYDLEVVGTHNFALASGVFVHNSSKMGRDRRTQAILPLRGKILNVERARMDKMLASVEIKALVIALGTAIGEVFDIGKLRYHKVIIATDADVDGAHIRTLLLTLFYRYFRPLIDGGFIYIAQPPLYGVKRGKDVHYFYTDAEKDAWLKREGISAPSVEESEGDTAGADTGDAGEESSQEADEKKIKSKKVSIQRYKGLGEMNPEELWETTMNPERRSLKQVTIEDAQDADHIFDVLMGTDVPSRKTFIQSNAKLANLDI